METGRAKEAMSNGDKKPFGTRSSQQRGLVWGCIKSEPRPQSSSYSVLELMISFLKQLWEGRQPAR